MNIPVIVTLTFEDETTEIFEGVLMPHVDDPIIFCLRTIEAKNPHIRKKKCTNAQINIEMNRIY